MASRPWSAEETDVLLAVVESPTWLGTALALLEGRSRSAIISQMSTVRRSLGIDVRRGRPSSDDWQPNAAEASAQLLAATLRVGRWS